MRLFMVSEYASDLVVAGAVSSACVLVGDASSGLASGPTAAPSPAIASVEIAAGAAAAVVPLPLVAAGAVAVAVGATLCRICVVAVILELASSSSVPVHMAWRRRQQQVRHCVYGCMHMDEEHFECAADSACWPCKTQRHRDVHAWTHR